MQALAPWLVVLSLLLALGCGDSSGSGGALGGGNGAGVQGGSAASSMNAGGGGGDAGGESQGAAGTGGAGMSSGCAKGGPKPEGQQTLTVDGGERSFFVVAATVSEPSPLIISFHGYGGTGQGDVGTFGLVEATAGGATLVFPDGVSQDWYQNAVGWDTRNSDTTDIHFAQALIDAALEDHCVDPTRIYVVGFSWGGWMSNQVACALGDEVRGFVSVAGGGPAGDCNASVGAMIVHGQADGAEPIAAGEESLDHWIGTNGCGSGSAPIEPAPCVAQDGCSKPVLWCEHGGGHEVPQFVRDSVWGFLLGL